MPPKTPQSAKGINSGEKAETADVPAVRGRPFKPGQVTNPRGRPPGRSWLTDIKELARRDTKEAHDTLVAAMRHAPSWADRITAATTILSYGHGRPVARVDVRAIRRIEDLSDDELLAIASDGPPLIEVEAVEEDGDQEATE